MRLHSLVISAVLPATLACLSACGSSSPPASRGDDAGASGDTSIEDTGATTSTTSGSDAAPRDTGATTTPTTSDATADVGSMKPCTAPSDCTGGEICCGRIPITGGTAPNCTTGTIVTRCVAASACGTVLGTTCSGVQTVRLCNTSSDCTESMYNQCCTFGGSADAGGLTFCADTLVSTFGGGTCM
jgi:hypothetical protein